MRADGYPFGATRDQWLDRVRAVREGWGDRDFMREFAAGVSPAFAADEELFEWFVWMQRLSASPAAAATSCG